MGYDFSACEDTAQTHLVSLVNYIGKPHHLMHLQEMLSPCFAPLEHCMHPKKACYCTIMLLPPYHDWLKNFDLCDYLHQLQGS